MERRALKYFKYGDPREVTELVTETISTDLGPHEVVIRWLASPISPVDINKIQGNYMQKPTLAAIAGSEGVGRVIKVGSSVTKFSPGDKIVMFALNCPIWADVSVVGAADLIKIDQRITPLQGSTMMGSPTTACVMMRMGGMQRGDWLVQNSANSAVGRAVIEIAKEKGYHTINIVRDRPDIQVLKAELTEMGGDVVWTEEEVKKEGRSFKGRPKLALNGVGGKSCLQISNLLARGGMLVTYGGMSKKPHEISTTALVFNDIKAVGVAIGYRMRDPTYKEETDQILREIQDYFVRGVLNAPPMDVHPLENFNAALKNSMDGKHRKQLFLIQEENASKL